MVTKVKARQASRRKIKQGKQKSDWDKLPKRDREELEEEYIYRVLDGKPTKRLVNKIARLKVIKLRRTVRRS